MTSPHIVAGGEKETELEAMVWPEVQCPWWGGTSLVVRAAAVQLTDSWDSRQEGWEVGAVYPS